MLSKEVYKKLFAFTEREEELYNLLKSSDLSKVKQTIEKYVEGNFTKGVYFAIEKHTRFLPVKEHFHNFIEIMYVLNGEKRKKVKGVEISCQDIQNLPILSTKKRKTTQQRERYLQRSAVSLRLQ